MNQELEIKLRSQSGYDLAREALGLMEKHGVWPTPLNYEIWVLIAAEPDGALAQEINRLLNAGEALTEEVAEGLASKFIARAKINDEVRDTGLKLTQELNAITKVITDAQTANKSYNATLTDAKGSLQGMAPEQFDSWIERVAEATAAVIAHNSDLESRLSDSAREVKSLRRHLDQVRMEAMTDALTNLANRKSFDENLSRMCESDSDIQCLTLAVVDIDHFKRFNDVWGHQTGDQVLRYVASVLGRLGRPPRLAARYGGEEFGLLFPNETADSIENLLNCARIEIASRVLKRRSTNEDLGCVTISAGIATRKLNEDPQDFVERADKALYASKNNGRNQVTLASEQLASAAA